MVEVQILQSCEHDHARWSQNKYMNHAVTMKIKSWFHIYDAGVGRRNMGCPG